MNVAHYFKKAILKHKHLENILNILINNECNKIFSFPKENRDFTIYNLLLNPMIMKAVISNCNGKDATQKQIKHVNEYFKDEPLLLSLKEIGTILNDKNISSIVSRLKKYWSNTFKNLKKFHANPFSFNGKPSTPKAKKLAKVFNYSIPLEVSKFSMNHKDKFGITIYKRSKKVFLKDNDYVRGKIINGITVSLYHGHIYYDFNYIVPKKDGNQNKDHSIKNKPVKQSGLEIGIKNLFALFVNDFNTQSLIYKNSKLIHYNVNFNKKLAKLNELIALQVSKYKEIVK